MRSSRVDMVVGVTVYGGNLHLDLPVTSCLNVRLWRHRSVDFSAKVLSVKLKKATV